MKKNKRLHMRVTEEFEEELDLILKTVTILGSRAKAIEYAVQIMCDTIRAEKAPPGSWIPRRGQRRKVLNIEDHDCFKRENPV